MDGVIIDSNPVHTSAWKEYLAQYDIRVPDLEARMYGRRNDEIVPDFFGHTLSPEEIFAHGAAKERLYRHLMAEGVHRSLVPGAVEFISAAAPAPLAVATNAEPANVSFVLKAAGLEGRFQVVLDGHQVQFPKPHPEIYLRAAAQLGVEPANCVVFEDSYTGTEAARRAGTRVVGVQTSHLTFPDVDFAISDFTDPRLVTWLSQQTCGS